MAFPAAHGGRLVLAAVLMGLLAAAVLAAGNITQAQTATTHQITRGSTNSALQTSLNAVFDSDGATLAAVTAGDTITFGPGEYEDIGRADGFYLRLDKANLTVRGARDPRKREADGQCDPTRDTILTGSSGFDLRAAGITVEHFCFQDIDDGRLAHANPQNLAPITARNNANGATVRRNRIDKTIGMGVNGRIGTSGLNNLTVTANEFIDIGLIATNGARRAIQPRHTGQEPSAIQLDSLKDKSNLTVTDNLFDGSARFGVSLETVNGGGTISGNTFRNMAKSAVILGFSPNFTLDNNTFEGNNHAAWRVVRRANWLNDGTYGISGIGTSTTGSKIATMESEALQDLMRLTRAEAVAAGMDRALVQRAAANTIYRDPDLHAAVQVWGSTNVTISNSTFTDNHNSIAICSEPCRVEGLEAVGAAGDTGRAPAYISPTSLPGGFNLDQSAVTLTGNQFKNSDTRSFDGPGSVGNHLVIGYQRAAATNNNRGRVAGTFAGTGNSYSGSGEFGGAAEPVNLHRITHSDTDSELETSLDQVWNNLGFTVAGVQAGDTIEFGPGVYEDIGRNGAYLYLKVANLTVRGARDPRLGQADGQCDPTRDTILTGSSGFILNAANITLEHFCFQNIDSGTLVLTNPRSIAPIWTNLSGSSGAAMIRRNRIDNTIGMGVNGSSDSALAGVTIAENEFIDIGLIVQPAGTGREPSALRFDTPVAKTNLRIVDNLFEGSAWAAITLANVTGGTISGNTFRNMAKSAVNLNGSTRVTLSNNTYEGNNRAAWRVVETADWLNDLKVGLSATTVGTKLAALESEALQTSLRLTKEQAVALEMDAALYDAATANSVYRDPRLHAAVRVMRSTNVTISDSTFTDNHNSIALCADVVCRVEGLAAVGSTGDTGRAPAYISPNPSVTSPASTVTLRRNQFNNSDTRIFAGPGSVGNHVVIGYFRKAATDNEVGAAAGAVTFGVHNSFSGSGVFGGAARAPKTHQITRGSTDAALTTSLNAVWDSDGATLDDVKTGDTIEFGPGRYEDIGRKNGFYLWLDKEIIVRGARDPRLGGRDGQCDPTTDTILTGSSGFDLRAAGITVEQICFQNIDDGSSAHASPHNLGAITAQHTANSATIRRNRIDTTIGMGVNGRISNTGFEYVTIAENEFIDIGLIQTNGAGDTIQPRHSGQEPSAIQADTLTNKRNLTITDNLFDGSAWVAIRLNTINHGGTISGNTFRNMAKSAVHLSFTPNFKLDNNTFEGNNRAAWRVVRTANWLNDGRYGLSTGSGGATKAHTMESEALQEFLRLTKAEAGALGMNGALYDAAAAADANSVYRDPGLHAAVWVAGSTGVTISNSTFTNNHNSIAICGHSVCRVDGLEAVGPDGDTGRAPPYISPSTWPGASFTIGERATATVTLSGNRFNNSDRRTFRGPGSIGNHVVVGYWRANKETNARGPASGSVTYGTGNSFSGSGVYGGAAVGPPRPVVSAPPPVFIPPPPPFKKDEVAVVDGAAKLEANKVTVDLVEGSLSENVETVEVTVTKLSRSKTPDAPDGGRFSIPSSAAFEIELEATLADETTEPLTELAIPVAVCMPIPRRVDNPVVLRYDAESEEWVKLPAVDSADEDLVCALSASFSDSFSVYAAADEAIHSEGLSANEINDFAVWEADYPLNASDLLAALLDVNLIWVWHDETWTGYATFEGEPIPGAIDFIIASGDTLWLGSVGSGEEDEG